MALHGNLSTDEHLDRNSHITKHTSRKSKASRSLVDHFHNESVAQSSSRRISSRLRERQEDVLSESLLCEVGDSINNSRAISELEQSIDNSGLHCKSDLTKDNRILKKLNNSVKITKTSNPKVQVSSDSDSTASLKSFECEVSNKVRLVTNKKSTSSCRSDRSLNCSKTNCNVDDLTVITDRSRLSSASHNATRGSFGSPQLVEESPDVVQISPLATKGHHVNRRTEITLGAADKTRSMAELSKPIVHPGKFRTPVGKEVVCPDDDFLENVTPRTRKELGSISCDRTQGKELFKKLLDAARAKLSRSAQKASSPMLSSPAIEGITSLAGATPTSQHKRLAESRRVTPTSQSRAGVSPFPTETHTFNRNIPVTPKTPKSVHFREFSSSPSVSKVSFQRSAVWSPGALPCGNSLKTPEQQRLAPANYSYTTPVNHNVPTSSDGRVPVSGSESPIPDTQPLGAVLLKDVVAYVEVRSNGEDRSAGVKSHLQELGATVVDRLTRKVTHVLFKEGLLSTYNKAMKWHIPLVTLQWIEECKKRECVVSERLFLPSNLDQYQSPDPLKKIKRVKYFPTGTDEGQKSRKVKPKRLAKLKMAQAETDASTETDTDSFVGNIRELNEDKDMSHESRLVHTLQKLVEFDEGSCQQDESSSPTSDDEMCIPLAVRLLRQLQNSGNKTHGSKDCDESESVRPADSDKNISKKFVNSENNEGIENMSPHHASLKSRKKLCLSTEKSSIPKHDEKKGTVSVSERNYVRLPVETASSKKTLIQDEIVDQRFVEKNLENRISNSTFNSSLMSNSSKVKSRKRKLMPLSQSSSPTLADTTLISQNSSRCGSGTSKRRRMCSQIYEEMDLTHCVPASNKDPDIESASASTTPPVAGAEQPCTSETSGLKRNRRLLTRRSVAVPSPSKSPHLVLSRRSSGVFVKTKQERISRHFPTLVLTSFPREDGEMIAACVMKLSGFQLEAKVSARTTHIVSNGPRRTLNMLKGIARGCWILTQDWVLNSLEAGKWLPEEAFEMKDFSPAVTQCRVERECLGPGFRLDLFKSCGPMLIAKQPKPPAEDLKELVRLCGGQLAKSVKDADIAIGLTVRNQRITCLSEKWILDSVTQLSIQSTNEYILERRQSNCVG